MRKLFSICLVACGLLLITPLRTATAEVTLFTRMVLMEAAYEPLMGRVAVAAVALDRVDDTRWPNNLQGVLSQRSQFSGLWIPFRQFREPIINGANVAIALAVSGSRPCGPRVYWYHADYILPPSWTRDMQVACHIGHHIFYREPH